MNTSQLRQQEHKEWEALVQKIKELEKNLKKYPEYYGLDIMKDNAKKCSIFSEQIEHYNLVYSALEQELALLEN